MILIGADPELFVIKDGKYHSAHGLIPGTKIKPHVVPDGAVQVDGLALEININPAKSSQEFIASTNSVLETLRDMVPDEFEIVISPTAIFEAEHIEDQPIEAQLLGCDPDYNAYTETFNEAPEADPVLRTAAGHIHVGWTQGEDPNDPKHFSSCISLVKQLDLSLGLASVLLDPDTQRKQLYGRAGAFRPKSYGLEYRVPSNFWLKSRDYMEAAYNITYTATYQMMNGTFYKDKVPSNEIEDIINNGRKRKAFSWLTHLDIYTPRVI